MRKVSLFFLLCLVLGCNFHSVKSERYGLANEREFSLENGQNDDLNMEDYYEDYGDDDVDAETYVNVTHTFFLSFRRELNLS